MATTKRKRTKRSGLSVGDRVLARGGDTWKLGSVSRSLFRGAEVDVRCDDGTMLRNLTSKDVKVGEDDVAPKTVVKNRDK